MKKVALAFGLVVLTSMNVLAQEDAVVEAVADAVATPAAVDSAPATEVLAAQPVTEGLAGQPMIESVIMEGTVLDGQMTVLDGQVIDGSQDMTYTAAPVAADCGCGSAAPVAVAAPVAIAAPVADCGCSAPAPVADCGCSAAPAPVAAPCCEAAPAPCCQPRQRKQVVRTWVSGLRARRSCCCN